MSDPDRLLRDLRRSVLLLYRNPGNPDTVRALVEAVRDVDSHLSWGGDLPRDWRVSAPVPLPEPDPGVADLMRRM